MSLQGTIRPVLLVTVLFAIDVRGAALLRHECRATGPACTPMNEHDKWHTMCGARTNCRLCGFCPSCVGPEDCVVCEDGYQLEVVNTTSCTGRCVPLYVEVQRAPCQPLCSCGRHRQIKSAEYSRYRHTHTPTRRAITLGLTCDPSEYVAVADTPTGYCDSFANTGTSCSVAYPDAVCTSGAGVQGCFRCPEFGLNCFSSEFIEVTDKLSCAAGDEGLQCNSAYPNAMCDYQVDQGYYGCFMCPSQQQTQPLDCSESTYQRFNGVCAPDATDGTDCGGSVRALCTNNADGIWGCWTCPSTSTPAPTPAPTPQGATLGSACYVGGSTCNACGGSYTGCTTRSNCDAYGTYCEDYSGTGSASMAFNSTLDASGKYVIAVSKFGSAASFAVRFGGSPQWLDGEESGANTWHCGSRMSNSLRPFERCELLGCGPFEVDVVTELETATWELRVCQYIPGNGNDWCECNPEGQCIWSARNTLTCECPASSATGYFSSDSYCKECTAGWFPQVAVGAVNRCTQTCKNYGVLNETTDTCDCVGAYEGTQCEVCGGGKVGAYCNVTSDVMSFDFNVSLTQTDSTFTPPLWKVFANSEAKVTVTTDSSVNLKSVLSEFKLIAVSGTPSVKMPRRAYTGRAAFEVQAAYYGPKPGLSSFTAKKYLHMFIGEVVWLYDYDNETRSFSKVETHDVSDYYKAINIDRCQEYLGDEYDRNYDAVFFWQDPAVRKPGYDSSSECGTYETRDYLVFVKGAKTCWATGDPDFGRRWSVSGIGQYTGWDRIEGLFMNTPDGSYWQNYEGIEFMDVFINESLADAYNRPNILRAGYIKTDECLDQEGKTTEWLRENCLIDLQEDPYGDSWDAMFAVEDYLIMVKNHTVQFMNITSMKCCNGSSFDSEPGSYCSLECETSHGSGVRLYGNALQSFKTPFTYPSACNATDDYSNCADATFVINTYVRNTTVGNYFNTTAAELITRITAVASGKLVTGVSTEASVPSTQSSSTTADQLSQAATGIAGIPGASGVMQQLGVTPIGAQAVANAVASPQTASAASCVYKFAEDDFPMLIFHEHNVWIVTDDEVPVKKNIAVAFPQLDRGFPYQLTWSQKAPVETHMSSADRSLTFKLVMLDEWGETVFLNEYLYPVLLECGTEFTAEANTCLNTLDPWIENATMFNASIVGPDVCRQETTAALTGWDAGGVLSQQGVFFFKDMGITKEGLYKIMFLHEPTGLTVTSDHIYVSAAECGDSSERGDTCYVDCSADALESSVSCTVNMDPNKEFVQLGLGINAFIDITIRADVMQPCCNSKGLCCAGNADCVTSVKGPRRPSPEEHCTCIRSLEFGLYDPRYFCATCIPGYDLIEGCRASSFDNDKISTYATTSDKDAIAPGKRKFFVVETQPETHLLTTVTNLGLGDVDLAVTFVTCPGQSAIAIGTPAPGALSPVCNGNGECFFNETTGTAQCICDKGYWGEACGSECCSGHGYCDQDTGDNCECTGTWSAVPRTVTTTTASLSTFVTEAERLAGIYDSPHNTEGTLNGTAGESFRAYVRWTGMDVPGKDAITYAAIELTQSVPTSCNGSARLLVYATQPATIQLPDNTQDTFCGGVGELACENMGCCTWNGTYCVGLVADGPATDEVGCKASCDVVQPHSREPSSGCGPHATFISNTASEYFGQCRCDDGYACAWGRCINETNLCGIATSGCPALGMVQIGGYCECSSTQSEDSDGDIVNVLYCENAQCVTPVYSLNYTWSATDLETKNLTDIEDLKSCLDIKQARFYGSVANVALGTLANSTVNTIVITDWLKNITKYLNSRVYDQMDLSFVFVVEPHEDTTCVPSFYSAAALDTSVRPKLVIQSKGNHQPSRLFLGLEDTTLSSLQSGHPFYGMWTVDTMSGLHEIGTPSSTSTRKVRRYDSELLASRKTKSLSCLDVSPPFPASSSCGCGMTETMLSGMRMLATNGLRDSQAILGQKQNVLNMLQQTVTSLEDDISMLLNSTCDNNNTRIEVALLQFYLDGNSSTVDLAQDEVDKSLAEVGTWQRLIDEASTTFHGHLDDDNGRYGTCPCSESAVFQDPIDYTQVGEWMYFLAHTDWETASDSSPACSSAEEQIFQGARELFFTKGTPSYTPGQTGVTGYQDGVSEDDTYSTQSQTDTRLGTSEYPEITGIKGGKWSASSVIRSNVFNMKVFTRAKELTKMRNPNCVSGSCGEIADEVLLFVGTEGGGDSPSTLEQEPSASSQVPALWMSEIIQSTGKPKAPVEVFSDVCFPSYVTVVTVTDPTTGSTFDQVAVLGVPGGGDDYEKSPPVDGYDQETGKYGSPPLKFPYRYVIPSSFSVVWGDTSKVNFADPVEPNVGPCTHPQGHPGFTMFNNKMYYYFDAKMDQTVLSVVRWNSQTDSYQDTVTLQYVNDNNETVTLIPSIPPLDKGYFKPVVVRRNNEDTFLLLSLGDPTGVPIDDVCLEAAGCNTSDINGVSPIQQYQQSFKCLNKNRGITDLYWWDGDTTPAPLGVHIGRVHVPTNDTEFPQDPTWTLSVTDTMFYWVKHTTGLSNRGFLETRAGAYNHTRDRQALMFTEYRSQEGRWDTTTVWEPGDARHIYDLTMWKTNVLFWAYDDLTNDDCYPPGRQMVYNGKVITAGVNIPAYSGCTRMLMQVLGTAQGVRSVYTGGDSDGVGVPRNVQCCDGVVDGAIDFNPNNPEHQKLTQVTEIPGCKKCALQREFWGWDHDALCCDGVGPVDSPTCIASCAQKNPIGPMMQAMEDFVYPRYNDPVYTVYNESAQWSKPATGWWFTGFHSLWTDPRMSRAGVPIWNLGKGLLDMGTKGNEKRLASGVDPGLVGYELYRPGGFAWREHWPRTIGVWQEQTDPLKNDCEGCASGYYGPTCASACPTYKGKVCNGYTCSEGIYGDGTCDCNGERGGIKCETDVHNQVYYFTATADTVKPESAPVTGCRDVVQAMVGSVWCRVKSPGMVHP
eukprot:TRINITY_DN3593_c0_g1_i3.p1 TRINITY_DN3593_c0_g1~~TRINITY_DN3593_c0_g1_i3.p1  ORF type:complete len:2947 (+),score=726.57 TRINITY_DN3593_c0_g1_i3:94-8934(+)